MRTPNVEYVDNPASYLVKAVISYWGITTANGNAGGTTIVCADLANEPSYAYKLVKILDGPSAGQVTLILTHVGNTLTVLTGFTNPAGGAQQITTGMRFAVLSYEPIAGAVYTTLTEIRERVGVVNFDAVQSHPNGVAEQTIFYFNAAMTGGTVFEIMGLWFDLSNLTQNTTIRTYINIAGLLRRVDTFAWTPAMDDGIWVSSFTSSLDWYISLQSAVAEGAPRDIPMSMQYRRLLV